METKSLLQHELLNIFTLLNIYLEESRISEKKKKEMLELIDVASILVSYEDLFLQQPLEFFRQKISLYEFLEDILSCFEEHIKKQKVKITLKNLNHSVIIDRHQVQESLHQIIRCILGSASQVTFAFDQTRKVLTISHDMTKNITLTSPLSECLKQKNYKSSNLALQVALHVLNAHGITVQLQSKKILFSF